jgi:hypothetical protein
MFAVQMFELDLAVLAALVGVDPRRKPKPTLERKVRTSLKPPREVLNLLEEGVESPGSCNRERPREAP